MAATSADHLAGHLSLSVVFIQRRVPVHFESSKQVGDDDGGTVWAGGEPSHLCGIQADDPSRVTCSRYRDEAGQMNDTGYFLQSVVVSFEPGTRQGHGLRR